MNTKARVKSSLSSLIIRLISIFLFTTTLYSIELTNEQFINNIDGWSVSNSSNVYHSSSYGGSMFIDSNDNGSKTYQFGIGYASQPLNVEVNWCATTQWDTSGDYLRININDINAHNDYDSGGCQTTTFTANATSTGDFKIEFSPRTNRSNEDAYIEGFTINGTPAPTSFTIGDIIINEGNYGIYTKKIPVTLINPDGNTTASVYYETSDGTATDGDDYNATSGTLTFTGTETTKMIEININGDSIVEPNESFNITLSNSIGASISDSSAQVTLQNDDGTTSNSGLRNFLIRNPPSTRNIRGNTKVIGNTVLCYKGTGSSCVERSGTNNANTLKWVTLKSSYTNSSTATYTGIPNSATIVWAGFYTQGYMGVNYADTLSWVTNNPSSLIAPNNDVIAITPTNIDLYQYKSYGYSYSTFNEVKSLIGKTGSYVNGDWTGANIPSREGNDGNLGYYGAWSFVVVYQDDSESLKNISIFDGYKKIDNADGFWDTTIDIDGFLTPTTGTVNSTISIFAADGEEGYAPDNIYINSQPVGNVGNAFYSYISGFTRSPSLTNNFGIDILNYDVGTNGFDVIKNGDTKATIKLDTENDTYFPSMIAFTAELYEPRVCYYQEFLDENGDAITSVNIGDTITVSVWISNMKKMEDNGTIESGDLETADKVEITMELHNVNFEYNAETTNIRNIGETQEHNKTDAAADDTAEFFTDTNTSVWRVGTGASGSDGGQLVPNLTGEDDKKTFINFQTTLLQSGDINITNKYFVSYENSLLGVRFGDESPLNIEICRNLNNNINVFQPALGLFNVVNQNSGITTVDPTDSADSKNALFTQIANKTFTVEVVSLDLDLTTLEDTDNSVLLEVVDASGITSEQSTCDAAPIIYEDDANMGVTFNNNDRENKIITISKANKNATFRMKFVDWDGLWQIGGNNCSGTSSMTGNLKGVPQCYNGTTEDNYNIKNPLFDLFNSVGLDVSECTIGASRACYSNYDVDTIEPPEYRHEYGCIACLLDAAPNYVCARDNFAIRPETYSIDMNETQLIGGRTYQLDINATQSGVDTNTSGYTQTIDNNVDKNATDVLDLPATCTTLVSNVTLFTSDIIFNNGASQTYSYTYPNVGDINITITDAEWTQVDQSAYNGKAFSDCIEGSSSNTPDANGKIGCLVSGMQQFEFVPKEFQNTLDVENFNDGLFTYISNDVNMSAKLVFQATAVLDNNSTATNYTAGCFSKDVNSTFTLISNPSNWLNGNPDAINRIVYFDDSNTTSLLSSIGGVGILASGEGNFTNGITNSTEARFNISRSDTNPDEPFNITRDDFNISINDENSVTGSGYSATADTNTTFYYGRSHGPDQRFIGNTGVASVLYEVYCDSCDRTAIGMNTYDESSDSINWYENSDHNTTNHGVFNKDPLTTSDGTTITGTTLNTVSLQAPKLPHKDKVQLQSDPWLVHTPTNFLVEFYQAGANWAGEGQLGETVDTNVSTRQNRRIDW